MISNFVRLIIAFFYLYLIPIAFAEDVLREKIGEVFGKPVYSDEISSSEGYHLSKELHRLFSRPVKLEYGLNHVDEFKPTSMEIEAATKYFARKHRKQRNMTRTVVKKLIKRQEEIGNLIFRQDLSSNDVRKLKREWLIIKNQLRPKIREFAKSYLTHWKFERLLYYRFGGGRILRRQEGPEAFDAMHQWLLHHEKKGDFKIADQNLRNVFYEYWTTIDHGSALIGNKDSIEDEFSHPPWVKILQNMQDRFKKRSVRRHVEEKIMK